MTHVVLPALVRSVKSLAGMAAGRWLLHVDFVEASASAEALVDPVSTLFAGRLLLAYGDFCIDIQRTVDFLTGCLSCRSAFC